MESAKLLDLLGNETRREILELLARKPCYVTEISDITGVSPKAVIDHLNRLSEAGLIEYRQADDRRKYFSITQSQRLEITISPYEFGTRNGYLRSKRLDTSGFGRVHLDLDLNEEYTDPVDLLGDLEELRQAAAELSRAQRFVHGEMNRLYEEVLEHLVGEGGARLSVDLLLALEDGPATVVELAEHFRMAPPSIERRLEELESAGLVRKTANGWTRR